MSARVQHKRIALSAPRMLKPPDLRTALTTESTFLDVDARNHSPLACALHDQPYALNLSRAHVRAAITSARMVSLDVIVEVGS